MGFYHIIYQYNKFIHVLNKCFKDYKRKDIKGLLFFKIHFVNN